LIFGNEFITPTVDEYGMYHAKAAALRSADLARQVGSVITTDEGEIIAAGCNEVPKPGGGAPWEDQIENQKYGDHRDFAKGFDYTAKIKLDIVAEIFAALKGQGWFAAKYRGSDPRSLAEAALFDDEHKTKDSKAPPLKNTRVSSIIEFGRSVHAEMSAITDAARRGLSVKGETLYCTTFPCHMCARHIVSAGINRVVFIEPYPKSMAIELYPEAITHEGRKGENGSTNFDPFIGVSPKRYLDLFEMRRRKDGRGNVIQWNVNTANMRIGSDWQIYFEVEKAYLAFLKESGLDIVGQRKRRVSGKSKGRANH
jgi:cytidine deaminase